MLNTIKNYINKTLKQHPDFWTTRLPWVLGIGVLVHLILGLIVFATECDVRYRTAYETWVGFLIIIMLLALVFYIIYLLRFNVFKRFGKLSSWHYVGTFLAFFITMVLCISWVYNPWLVTSFSARAQYNDTQIAHDINRINVLINTLEYDSIPHLWTRQKVTLAKKTSTTTYYEDYNYGPLNGEMQQEEEYYDNPDGTVYKTSPVAQSGNYEGMITQNDTLLIDNRIARLDTMQFNAYLKTDSIQRIDDSSYYRFYGADYTYLNSYHSFFTNTNVDEIEDKELFYKTIAAKPIIENRTDMTTELRQLIEKYWAENYQRYPPYSNYEVSTMPYDYKNYINRKYKIYDLDEGLKNISSSYYLWRWSNLDFLIYPLYYFALAMALMLFLFRHNRKKTFFYTLLAGVVLFILSVTVMAFIKAVDVVLPMLIFYMVVFGVGTARIFIANRKNILQDISMNLFIFFSPLLPLLLTAQYYEVKKKTFAANNFNTDFNYSRLYAEAFQYQDTAMVASQILGFILFIILLHFVFSKILRKSYSLPEN